MVQKEFQNICKDIQSLIDRKDTSNHERRVTFAEAELYRLELEAAACKCKEEEDTRVKKISELEKLLKQIQLKKEKHFWYDSMDRWLCGIAGWLWLLTATIFFCIPVLLIKPLDGWLLKKGILSPQSQISETIEKFIANTMLLLSGADLVVIDGDASAFTESKIPLVCFSHGSTLDTFALGSLIPMKQHTLAKKELFLIPFLNLLLYTFGGIPIDRTNRNAAVTAIQNAMKSAESTDACIMIAPEGTRSKTGHLLPFKKGPFYIWEDLQSTIIPVVITGAYELCPPGMYTFNLYVEAA